MRSWLPWVVLAVAACAGEDEAPTPYRTTPGCVTSARTAATDEATPTGESVAARFAPAAGDHAVVLPDGAGGTTELAVRVTLEDAPALLVRQESPAGEEIGGCRDEYQRLARIEYRTADGRFDEAFPATLRSLADVAEAYVQEELAGATLRGTEGLAHPEATYRFWTAFGAGYGAGRIERDVGTLGEFSWGTPP